MRAAIIIPARLEATRLPGKLLLRDTGMPLICHTLMVAVKVRELAKDVFSHIMVAADAPAILKEVERFAAEKGLDVKAVMTDPGHRSGSDRIAEAARGLPDEVNAILNLQGDEPELPPKHVLDLVETFQGTKADIATLVHPVADSAERKNPALVKVVLGRDGRALYFSRNDIPYRRADGPFAPPAYGHVGIYLYRRDALERFVALPPGALEQTEKLEQLRALENGMTIVAHVLDQSPPKGIDTPEDYAAFVKRRT